VRNNVQGEPDYEMIRYMILRKIDSVERRFGVSMDYVRHIVRTSLRSFFKFAKVLSAADYRRVLPLEPLHIARIVATRDADCGTCVQIEVNEAKRRGLDPDLLRAVVEGNVDALDEASADVYRFTEAVVTANGEDEALRERMRQRYGDEGLIELSMAMAACRFFPVIKRGLGYATSCSEVEIQV
jgi:alkylhydroperoxidase family enzyme